ncbi:nucleotidyltransferase family protein [Sphingomonas qomolangmaensis]|uniref:Nucleotidyltransferase family protein n=1 Tax=Sphingomonas qomolangmaensis TaxID=2918765 RepID=A0ABY5L9I3_9SPHN|nr:nucleotidyltransferase family protein [Sphingomonas qomolangmaensis]UUL82459.1 nucleotidyltransferase family protein [Sphingomonas qomolangmaensis]
MIGESSDLADSRATIATGLAPVPGADTLAFLLVRICIARPPVAAYHPAIRSLAQAADCDRLLAITLRHGVAGLVAQAVSAAGVAVPPRVAAVARKRGFAALRQAQTALALHDALHRVGVAVLVLKGSTLAQRFYATIGVRESVDIDLAVAPDDVSRSWRMLEKMGFDRVTPRRLLDDAIPPLYQWAAKDSIHRHRDSGLVVELHWRLSDDLVRRELPPPPSWQPVEIEGRTLMALGDDDLFVYLCTHGAAHAWARLKWLADIAAMLAAAPDGGARYWRHARAAGSARAAASALLLAHQLLGTPLPSGFAYRSRRVALLNRIAICVITAGGGTRELSTTRYRGWAEFAAKLLIAPRFGNMLAIVRRVLVSGEDVGMLALPRGFVFLYPLLRVPLLVVRRVRRAQLSANRSRSRSS